MSELDFLLKTKCAQRVGVKLLRLKLEEKFNEWVPPYYTSRVKVSYSECGRDDITMRGKFSKDEKID